MNMSSLLATSFSNICFFTAALLAGASTFAAAVVSNSLPLEAFSHIGLLDEKCISNANARFSSTLVPQSFRDWKTLRDCSRQIHLLHGDTSDEILVHYAIVATSNCSGPQPFCNPGSVKWSKKNPVNPGNSKDVDLELQSLSVPAYSGGLHRLGMVQLPRPMALTSGRITNQTETTLTHTNWGNPATDIYQSPDLWVARLSGLQPGETISYAVPGSPNIYQFTVGGLEKITLGLAADVGQTSASNATLQGLQALGANTVLLAGDLSYADGFLYAWDRFGILLEASYGPLVPTIACPGDHEVWFGEQFVQYSARFAPDGRGYRSHNIGPVHIVSINTYEPFQKGTSQYRWIEEDLSRVDCITTPWVIVMGHDPMYYSNKQYSMQSSLPDYRIPILKENLEELWHRYRVDIYLNGHVHAYERTKPIYRNASQPCGTVYITAGDGGNYEGKNSEWFEKPEWSAFRSDNFGYGSLKVENVTHALLEWYRNDCQNATSAVPCNNQTSKLLDTTWIVRGQPECACGTAATEGIVCACTDKSSSVQLNYHSIK